MKLSPYTINVLKDVIIGDSKVVMPRLTGQQITNLFNAFAVHKEIYPKDWKTSESEFTVSRKVYAEKRLNELNGTRYLLNFIEAIIQPIHFEQHNTPYNKSIINSFNNILLQDGYKLIENDGVYKVTGSLPPDDVKVEIHFEDIQSQIIEQIISAKYLIWITVAWFTDIVLMKAIYEKKLKGINIQIIVYDDEINQKWGILKPERANRFDLYKIKYNDNIKMHNKFCIIDLKTVIHGSYNWTDKARYNDETISIDQSREIAETFADEFIRLKLTATK